MKRLYIIILTFISIILFSNKSYTQSGESPYPVIFVHGLNSDDQTWSSMLSRIGTAWNISPEHTLYFVLNARGGDTTDYLQDVIFPERNVSGTVINRITYSSIYSVNFRNFWNRNPADPRIIQNSDALPGTNQSSGNESAIYKQGYALMIFIDSVLRVTGSEKVILLGHSMGGLAIREYLQRRENGINKWWVDQKDTVNGHRVAKVVTIGTPHLGTNVGSIPFSGIDFNSEAIRDMRNSYSSSNDAAYLFGNIESSVPSNFYNEDINCNGQTSDIITGISQNSTYNSFVPLPSDILYTWIISNYLNFGSDLAVPVSSQSLYDTAYTPHGVTDTLMTNKNHIQETSDTRTLLRGLDEPDSKEFAYSVSTDKFYSGFITQQTRGGVSDSDFYSIGTLKPGDISISISSLNAGVNNLTFLSESGTVLQSKNIFSSPDSILIRADPEIHYVKITGNSNLNPNINNYKFNIGFIPVPELYITIGIEGMQGDTFLIQDTVRIYLRDNKAPFNKTDSAIVYPDNEGFATAFFMNANSGNYYLQISHRNALETWSSLALNFTNGSVTDYDLTASKTSAFGGNLIEVHGKWTLYSGDIDRNGVIDLSDMINVNNDAGEFVSGYTSTDLNGDDLVNLSDVLLVYNNSADFVMVLKP